MHFRILRECQKHIFGLVQSIIWIVFKKYFLLLFALDIVHPDIVLKYIVSPNAKIVDDKVDVGNQFTKE